MKKTIQASDVEEAGNRLIDALTDSFNTIHCCVDPPADYRRRYSSIREAVVQGLSDRREFGKYSRKVAEVLFALALAELERQGYVERTPLEGESDHVIDTTRWGEEELFFGNWPVYQHPQVGGSSKPTEAEVREVYGPDFRPPTVQRPAADPDTPFGPHESGRSA
jgi:hypothetical protein